MNKRQRYKYNQELRHRALVYFQVRSKLIDAALTGDEVQIGVAHSFDRYMNTIDEMHVILVNNKVIWRDQDWFYNLRSIEPQEAVAMLRDYYLKKSVPEEWLTAMEEKGVIGSGQFVHPRPGPLFDRHDRLSHNDPKSRRIKHKAKR